ncbi:MAG: hypothetical protein AAF764_00775 [Pseudomonadota bacterium]
MRCRLGLAALVLAGSLGQNAVAEEGREPTAEERAAIIAQLQVGDGPVFPMRIDKVTMSVDGNTWCARVQVHTDQAYVPRFATGSYIAVVNDPTVLVFGVSKDSRENVIYQQHCDAKGAGL